MILCMHVLGLCTPLCSCGPPLRVTCTCTCIPCPSSDYCALLCFFMYMYMYIHIHVHVHVYVLYICVHAQCLHRLPSSRTIPASSYVVWGMGRRWSSSSSRELRALRQPRSPGPMELLYKAANMHVSEVHVQCVHVYFSLCEMHPGEMNFL